MIKFQCEKPFFSGFYRNVIDFFISNLFVEDDDYYYYYNIINVNNQRILAEQTHRLYQMSHVTHDNVIRMSESKSRKKI
ncbi:hypothetical protein DERP_003091 [Dermatophagoides pteronyssinus]|uniref:Uncharacterized protein n=1 Tax=Dermatophagoides pteronyssinus TaxID=6956 RepID=A0ABQ8JJ30_DERPT|nr:hypothetical protein DERP_003091 [Dermatophagoides pteronyssinus]